MKLIYVSSPFRGEVKHNTHKARQICRTVAQAGHYPIAPHLNLPQFLDDEKLEERTLALALCLNLLVKCDEIWICTIAEFGHMKLSDGMKLELQRARQINLPERRIWSMEALRTSLSLL